MNIFYSRNRINVEETVCGKVYTSKYFWKKFADKVRGHHFSRLFTDNLLKLLIYSTFYGPNRSESSSVGFIGSIGQITGSADFFGKTRHWQIKALMNWTFMITSLVSSNSRSLFQKSGAGALFDAGSDKWSTRANNLIVSPDWHRYLYAKISIHEVV